MKAYIDQVTSERDMQVRFIKRSYSLFLALMIWTYFLPFIMIWNLMDSNWAIRLYGIIEAVLFISVGGIAIVSLLFGIIVITKSIRNSENRNNIHCVLLFLLPIIYSVWYFLLFGNFFQRRTPLLVQYNQDLTRMRMNMNVKKHEWDKSLIMIILAALPAAFPFGGRDYYLFPIYRHLQIRQMEPSYRGFYCSP